MSCLCRVLLRFLWSAIELSKTVCILCLQTKKRPRLTLHQRYLAIAWLEVGWSMNAVVKKMKVARSTVQALRRKYNETGLVEDRPGRGRNRKTSIQDRRIVRASLSTRTATSRELALHHMANGGTCIASSTVRKRLLEGGLKCYRAAKPGLSKDNRRARLAWA